MIDIRRNSQACAYSCLRHALTRSSMVTSESPQLRKALVIHPVLSIQAGGEFLCAHVCAALQEMGYEVSLACDVLRPADFQKIYGVGRVFERCEHIPIPRFKPIINRLTIRLILLQRLGYARKVWHMFADTHYDLVFSTQSSPFILPNRVLHFVYSVRDVYSHPPEAAKLNINVSGRGARALYLSILKQYSKYLWRKRAITRDWFFAVGSAVLDDLREIGYSNSSLAFPPCRVNFTPRFPKKKQVIQVARIVPDKRLDLYLDIASKLPDYDF